MSPKTDTVPTPADVHGDEPDVTADVTGEVLPEQESKPEPKPEPEPEPEPEGGWIVYKNEEGEFVRIPRRDYRG